MGGFYAKFSVLPLISSRPLLERSPRPLRLLALQALMCFRSLLKALVTRSAIRIQSCRPLRRATSVG